MRAHLNTRHSFGQVYGDGEGERLLGQWIKVRSFSMPPFALGHTRRSGTSCFDDLVVVKLGRASELNCHRVPFCVVQERTIPRERIVLITKGGCHGQDKLWSANISESSIRSDIEGSCERMGIEHVDVFMLHRDDPKIDVATIVNMMDIFQREGLVTVWGVSNWALPRLQAALEYARANGKAVPVCDSLQFSLAQPTRSVWPDTQFMTADARKWYASTGTAVLAWECLAKGFMAGKVSVDTAAVIV